MAYLIKGKKFWLVTETETTGAKKVGRDQFSSNIHLSKKERREVVGLNSVNLSLLSLTWSSDSALLIVSSIWHVELWNH